MSILSEGTIKLPGRLMQAPVPVVPDSKCQQFYGSDVNMRYMFCAGYDKGGKDSCQVRNLRAVVSACIIGSTPFRAIPADRWSSKRQTDGHCEESLASEKAAPELRNQASILECRSIGTGLKKRPGD